MTQMATLNLRSVASICNMFFKILLTRPIFAQRVCMGVDKYDIWAFKAVVWCIVDVEQIVQIYNCTTLKLSKYCVKFAICFFKNMLTQPIFAQIVCMGLDKYAIWELPMYIFKIYSSSTIHFDKIPLATSQIAGNLGRLPRTPCLLKIWLSQPYFGSKGVHGSWRKWPAIWGWRLVSGVLLMWSRFSKSTFGNSSTMRSFADNLEPVFLNTCKLSQYLLQGCAWEWTNMHLSKKGVAWCIVDEE